MKNISKIAAEILTKEKAEDLTGKPTVFLGGSCEDNNWREQLIKEFKEFSFLDPFDKDWKAEDNIYDECFAFLNADYVIFYKGGKLTEKEKELLQKSNKKYQEFNNLLDLRNYLKTIKTASKIASTVLYHSAPIEVRQSIKKNGINPNLSEHGRWDETDKGFYAFKDIRLAEWYAKEMANQEPEGDFDIWKVTVPNNIKIGRDIDLMIGEVNDNVDSFYVTEPVSSKFVQFVKIIKHSSTPLNISKIANEILNTSILTVAQLLRLKPHIEKKALNLLDLMSDTSRRSIKYELGCTATKKKANPEAGRWLFSVKCSEAWSKGPYKVNFKILQARTKDPMTREIEVSCNCNAWRYNGADANALQKDYSERQYSNGSTPSTRDPKRKYLICKHVAACIPIFSGFIIPKGI